MCISNHIYIWLLKLPPCSPFQGYFWDLTIIDYLYQRIIVVALAALAFHFVTYLLANHWRHISKHIFKHGDMQIGVQCDFHTHSVLDSHKTSNFTKLAQNQSLHHRPFNIYISLCDYRLIKFPGQNLATFKVLPLTPTNKDFTLFLSTTITF